MPLSRMQGIVRQLRQSDAQLFAGWGGHAGINDAAVLEKLRKISQTAVRLLKVCYNRVCR